MTVPAKALHSMRGKGEREKERESAQEEEIPAEWHMLTQGGKAENFSAGSHAWSGTGG